MVIKQRARIVQSIRVNPKLWASFKEAVEKKGFSICFILETLMQAWTTGAAAIVSVTESSSLAINQKIEYVVERPRRKRGGGVIRGPLENCYQWGVWSYRKPETSEVLSKLGHVPECECNACKPYRHAIRINRGRVLGSRTLKL